jgi:lipid A 4'-phosphatase
MRYFLLFSVALAIMFIAYPKLDLTFHHLFYSKDVGFYLKDNPVVVFFYNAVPIFVRGFVALLLLSALYINIRKRKILGIGNKEVIYLLLVLAIGPGLIVNGIFKEHWGRARPAQITEFGGTKHFSPAFIPADQCEKNCSFVSGHASVGFYLVAVALLLKRWRKTAITIALTIAAAIGFARIAQGGHFLSDVIFSGVFTVLSAVWVYELMYRLPKKELS